MAAENKTKYATGGNREKKTFFFSAVLIFLVVFKCSATEAKVIERPNIVFVVSDDLGWNDVSWNNDEMQTPHLQELSEKGIRLENYYVQPICTPSRGAFLSGLYPFHTGTQHGVFHPLQNVSLPLSISLLPQILREEGGYKTHLVGKWHLGFCNWSMTPTHRGFDSFYGYYNGEEGHYSHRLYCNHNERKETCQGLDFTWNKEKVVNKNGTYSTEVFSNRAIEIIEQHPKDGRPLFLMLAFQAVHAPLEPPPGYPPRRAYRGSESLKDRMVYSSMVNSMDKAVGKIVRVLQQQNMSSNTIFIFTTDNGGRNENGGNNWPLRGEKGTLWEGGTKAIGFIYSPILKSSKKYFNGLMHAVDWMPTILHMANVSKIPQGIDGVSQWNALNAGPASFPRKEFVYNIFLKKGSAYKSDNIHNAGLRYKNYKFMTGNPGTPDGWIPPPHLNVVQNATNTCEDGVYLFDIAKDPCERNNLAGELPEVVGFMSERLKNLTTKYFPYRKGQTVQLGNPSFWGDTFSPGWC